jgi:hypothetical protein
VFLREIRATALAEGKAKGRAEGEAEGIAKGRAEALTTLVHDLLAAKFGPLPKWARARVDSATPAQLERWAKKVLTADALDEVIAKR